MDVSVILTTYRQPAALEKTLWAYAAQTVRPPEVVVADDGSGPETGAVLERARAETRLVIRHVWHEDRGFRKCEILNRAVLAAEGSYLIFSDGDCLPREDFVATHLRLSRPGRFLGGGALRAPEWLGERIGRKEIEEGRFLDPRWLRVQGVGFGRRSLRLWRNDALGTVADALNTTRARFDGGNSSAWKSDVIAVNGFDCTLSYGYEDHSLGARLRNGGLRPVQVGNRAVVLHVEHPRPYKTDESMARGRRTWEAAKRDGVTWVESGITSMRGLSEVDAPSA